MKPTLVVEVEFTEWTREGRLRHPAYKGIREDKLPRNIIREADDGEDDETPAKTDNMRKEKCVGQVAGVSLTHPERILYEEQGISKRDLAQYYEGVADHILPHLQGRPVSLVRCPQGRSKACFFQRHRSDSTPDIIKGIEIKEEEATASYVTVDSIEALITLIQIGTLEFHPWGSRVDHLNKPDRMVFVLDPGDGATWQQVTDAAREVKSQLDYLG